jgi:hypothetical protein
MTASAEKTEEPPAEPITVPTATEETVAEPIIAPAISEPVSETALESPPIVETSPEKVEDQTAESVYDNEYLPQSFNDPTRVVNHLLEAMEQTSIAMFVIIDTLADVDKDLRKRVLKTAKKLILRFRIREEDLVSDTPVPITDQKILAEFFGPLIKQTNRGKHEKPNP